MFWKESKNGFETVWIIGLYEYRFENRTRARVVECFEIKVKETF